MPLRPLILLLVLLLPACTGVTPGERDRSRRAYEKRLAVSNVKGVDRFFLDHPDDVLRPPLPDSATAAREADSALARLSTDEKIGQLFIVDLPVTSWRTLFNDRALELVGRYHVSGFLVPRAMDSDQVFRRVRAVQAVGGVPLFIAADYERGVGNYRSALTELPSNMALGATRDTVLAAAAGRLTAIEARATGINLLLAPVVDVNNNPDNPIINIRSYGEDPHLVASMAGAFVQEAQRYGLLTTLKHYPGHGNTSVDTHSHLGRVEASRAVLDTVELLPYRRLVGHREEPAAVMSAHLWVTAFDRRLRPATLSRRALTGVLREELGFRGIILTDDIKMGALRDNFSHRERIVGPLLAGADIVLTPPNVGRAVTFVREALDSGELTSAELDAKVRRILVAKARAGLFLRREPDRKAYKYLARRPRGAYLAQTIADQAVTLLKADRTVPLQPDQHITLVQLSNYGESASIDASMELLKDRLGKRVASEIRLGRDASEGDLDRLVEAGAEPDAVVLALYLRLQSGRGEAGLFPGQMEAVRRLMRTGRPVVVVTFGNPYVLAEFPRAAGHLVAFDQSIETVEAVAGVLLGEQPARGRLPITLDSYTFGAGITRLSMPKYPEGRSN